MNLRGLIGRLQVSGLDREAAGFRGLIVRLRVWGLIVRCEGLIVRCIKARLVMVGMGLALLFHNLFPTTFVIMTATQSYGKTSHNHDL